MIKSFLLCNWLDLTNVPSYIAIASHGWLGSYLTEHEAGEVKHNIEIHTYKVNIQSRIIHLFSFDQVIFSACCL